MKKMWDEMSAQLTKQNTLTNKLIMDMTRQRYSQKFSKVMTYESIGSILCFGMAAYLLVNFRKLDTWYLAACGSVALLYLTVLPVLVLNSIHRMRNINIGSNSYKETIVSFERAKKQLLLVQRTGIYLNIILVAIAMPVAGKLISNKDFLQGNNYWLWYLPVMGIFIALFSRWAYHCYVSIANSAGDILKELKE